MVKRTPKKDTVHCQGHTCLAAKGSIASGVSSSMSSSVSGSLKPTFLCAPALGILLGPVRPMLLSILRLMVAEGLLLMESWLLSFRGSSLRLSPFCSLACFACKRTSAALWPGESQNSGSVYMYMYIYT